MAMTFQEKYERARPSYVKVNEKRFADLEAGTTVLVPSPQDIERELYDLDSGRAIEPKGFRRRLADRHDADGACPVMSGMHLRVVAELALEAIEAGMPISDVAPFWLVVTPESPLAQKLPGGPDRIARFRATSDK